MENNRLQNQIADLQANLTLSETKLASQQADQKIEHLRRQLNKAETEVQRLHAKYENRAVPYHFVIQEHFDPKYLD